MEPDGNTRAYIDLAGVRAVVRSPHLGKLTHVRFRLSDMGDDGCREIVASGILKRLKMLDLMHGRVSDEGANLLAGSPDVRSLDLLEISYNRLTTSGISALTKAGVAKVQATNQYDPNQDDEEQEYLWMGDME